MFVRLYFLPRYIQFAIEPMCFILVTCGTTYVEYLKKNSNKKW